MSGPNRDAVTFYVRATPPRSGERQIDLSHLVTKFSYEDDDKKPDKLEIALRNEDLKQFENPAWQLGTVLKASWGYPGLMAPERTCHITQWKGGPKGIHITAEGSDVLWDRVIKVRSFEWMKRSEVVRQIAAEYGIDDLYGLHIDEDDPVEPSLTQARMSDLHFCQHLASDLRWDFFLDFDGVHFHEKRLGAKPIRELVYWGDPGRGDIIDWSIDKDLKGSAKHGGQVTVWHVDLDKKLVLEHTVSASGAATPRLSPVLAVSAAGEKARGARSVTEAATVHASGAATPEAAKAKAAGLFSAGQLKAVQLGVTIWGDPLLIGKSQIALSGISAVLSGTYRLEKVHHAVFPGVYTGKLTCKRQGDTKRVGDQAVESADGQPVNDKKPDGGTMAVSKAGEASGDVTKALAERAAGKGRK